MRPFGGCGDGYDDACIADLKLAEAVNDADVRNLELLLRPLDQLLHFLQRHRLIGFVNKVQRLAALRELADVSVKRDGRAAFGRDDAAGDAGDVDGRGCKFKEVHVIELGQVL